VLSIGVGETIMSIPPSELLIHRAAELRASGKPWDQVGDAVGRKADTVRKWPQAYPDLWLKATAEAEKQIVNDAGAEAILTLRQGLRSEDEKLRRDAAKILLDWRLKRQRSEKQDSNRNPVDDWTRLIDYLRSLDHAAIQALASECETISSDPVAAA
jgi:hypothetical protein